MVLTTLNNLIDGKFDTKNSTEFKSKFTIDELSENVELFRELLLSNTKYDNIFNKTDIPKVFYDACPLFQQVFPSRLQIEVFYATKLGFIYENVPSKLVYLLRLALKLTESPNLAIQALDEKQLAPYLKEEALPRDVTIKQIMANLLGTDFSLLTDTKRKVKYKDFYEVYVENVDRVILLPEDLAGYISSFEDLQNVNYKHDIGVCVYDTPIRTLGGRVGITFHEYDLRRCF